MMVWKAKSKRFNAMVMQLADFEYGPYKFLEENPLQMVDAGMIYILRKNIALQVFNYGSAISCIQSFEKEFETIQDGGNN